MCMIFVIPLWSASEPLNAQQFNSASTLHAITLSRCDNPDSYYSNKLLFLMVATSLSLPSVALAFFSLSGKYGPFLCHICARISARLCEDSFDRCPGIFQRARHSLVVHSLTVLIPLSLVPSTTSLPPLLH